MGRLDGSVALVTGAARGQGEAIARRFVGEGASVVLGDILDEAGAAVAESLAPDARYVHLDVSQEADWASAVSAAVETYGRLTVLINNAGIVLKAPLEDMTLDQYMRVVSVNQAGCWLGMRAAA